MLGQGVNITGNSRKGKMDIFCSSGKKIKMNITLKVIYSQPFSAQLANTLTEV